VGTKARRTVRMRQPPARPWWRSWRVALVGIAGVAGLALVAYAVLAAGGPATVGGATAWATLRTADVHALAFDPADTQHLYFGHHNGLLESRDGGRTWQPTALSRADAMNVQAGDGELLQIAGHNAYMETTDGGETWQPVPNDLPGLDLHAFVTDPADPERAWAYAVGFGLFETTDRGRHWERRHAGDWPVIVAHRAAGTTILVGASPSGLLSSSDGGRSWQPLGSVGGQIVSLAAAPNGSVIYAGTTRGLVQSSDSGRTWQPTGFTGTALAVAAAPNDPRIVAIVDEQTRFFRSADGGASWPGPR
jgi:photosystem II stability/assembly factor-like uncharacterized protein